MTSAQLADARLETYLDRLRSGLREVSPEYRQDILREIRAHIVDSTEHSSDQAGAVDRVLRLLGAPEELAFRYSTECQLQRASRSFSPWLILRTCWHWAKLGIKGTLAFFVALFGYSLALGFTGAVFLKPLVPSKVGVWVGPEGFNVGVPAHPERMHELLGNYFVPVIAAAAFLSAIGTTRLLRWMMRKRAPGLTVSTEKPVGGCEPSPAFIRREVANQGIIPSKLD
jgi:uncharacterized membrane protein